MPTPRTAVPSSLRPSGSEETPLATATATPPISSYIKRRSFVYAAGFAVITIAGTLIGATLKSRNQADEKMVAVKQKVQLDVGEQIAVLEETRLNLVQRRGLLERKIREVRDRESKDVEIREERDRLRVKREEEGREMALGRGRG